MNQVGQSSNPELAPTRGAPVDSDACASAKNRLSVHLAEYAALTNRCTYWLTFQVPIWTALIAFLALIPLLWSRVNHLLLLLGAGFGAQLLVLVWFQTIEEQYLAISYLERKLRPRVQTLIGTNDFWGYESFSAGRQDRLNWWGEWLLPAVTAVGLLVFVIVAMRRSLLQSTDYAVLVLLGLNVIVLAFQVLKTSKRVRLRRSVARIAECRYDDVKKGTGAP